MRKTNHFSEEAFLVSQIERNREKIDEKINEAKNNCPYSREINKHHICERNIGKTLL